MSVLWYPMQLSMVISADAESRMPPAPVPGGYEIRGYRAGEDDEAWRALINTGAFGTPWPRSKFDEYLDGPERREGSRLAVKDGRVLAATFASVEDGSDSIAIPDDVKGMGRVDFVISHPDARRLGLGRAVCTAVVKYLFGRGYSNVILWTDNWRIPAIAMYLSMGFEPNLNRGDMPERWEKVMEDLEEWRRTYETS